MNYFIFVLGSNFKLSLGELDYCLKNSRFKGRIADYSANVAIVEFESLHQEKYYVNSLADFQYILGGVQKIAKVYNFIDIQTIQQAFPRKVGDFNRVKKARKRILSVLNSSLDDIFPNIQGQDLFYAVSIYPNFYDDEYYSQVLTKHFLPFLNKKIMSLLFEKGAKKALYFKYPEKNIKSGNLNPIFPHHVITYELLTENRAELIFGFTEEGVYLGRTFTADDPNFKKKIDEERPHKDFKSSISPKLSLILLNFLNLFSDRQHKKILDPFVGNGTILLFAFLHDFEIYGADARADRVKNTRENLAWLIKELDQPPLPNLEKKIINSDISQISIQFPSNFFDGICTEPFLGPFFKEKPYFMEAQEVIETQINPLFELTFRESLKVLKKGGKLCITAPIIHTLDGGEVKPNINAIADRMNLKRVPLMETNRIVNKSNDRLRFPLKDTYSMIDAKKDQIVNRKIYVFEK